MTLISFLNSLLLYAAYLLGAAIFILDIIQKFYEVGEANPDPKIVYKKVSFWHKERFNLIRMLLLGIISTIFLPKLFGGSIISIKGESGAELYNVPMKAALIPIQIIIGWTGGRAILALMGKSKKELYRKVGIDETKDV